MKYITSIALLLSVAGCSAADIDHSESLGEVSEALNGSPAGAFLTKRNLPNQPDENARRTDTQQQYYNVIGTDANGSGASITAALGNLQAFRNKYFLVGTETIAKYYNRGDLGLGREMHCVDRTNTDGQVACYVVNFVSAPLDAQGNFAELSFGLSPNIAFDNMLAFPQRPLATVAMVFRAQAPASKDKVIFMAYNAAGTLANNAPLDRYGINYANEFKTNPHPDPNVFGTPGVNFNNHIPSNCLNCHGGTYNAAQFASPKVTNAFFLPFDLDQFEYKDAAGLRRADQETAFRNLNQVARRVAFRSTFQNTNSLVKQIDGWHGNSAHSEILVNNFNSNFVPLEWQGANDIVAYRGVVRRSCRGCHTTVNKPGTPQLNFDTAADFQAFSGLAALDIKNHQMAHALQTQREFWQSPQHVALADYWRVVSPSAADTLSSAGPDRLITLDPHILSAVN